jgi:hypothetical protein
MSKKLMVLVAICFMAMTVTAYGADKLIVQDGSSVTKFVVTDTGNTGIGTATPLSQMYVVDQAGTDAQRGIITAQHNNSITAAVIQFKRSRGTEASPLALQNGDNGGAFHAYLYDGSGLQITSSIIFKVNGTVSTGSIPTDMVFYTGTASASRPERMRITSDGYVGIGTSTPTLGPLQMASGAYVSAGGTWQNASSRVLKENIKTLSAADANKTLKGLNPVLYNYKVDKAEKHVGFIAEDVPDMVASKDRKGLSALDIVAVLTKVVQDKTQVIDNQQKIINAMAAKLEMLEEKVNRLETKGMTASR